MNEMCMRAIVLDNLDITYYKYIFVSLAVASAIGHNSELFIDFHCYSSFCVNKKTGEY